MVEYPEFGYLSAHLFIILFLHFFPSHSLAVSFLNASTSCDIHWEQRFWTSALLPPFSSITDKRLYKEPVILITFYPEFPVYFNHLEFSRTTASLSFHTQPHSTGWKFHRLLDPHRTLEIMWSNLLFHRHQKSSWSCVEISFYSIVKISCHICLVILLGH